MTKHRAPAGADGLPLLAWRPSKVLLFPSVKRAGLAMRIARGAAPNRCPSKAISAALNQIEQAHARKGVPREIISADIDALRQQVDDLIPIVRAEMTE